MIADCFRYYGRSAISRDSDTFFADAEFDGQLHRKGRWFWRNYRRRGRLLELERFTVVCFRNSRNHGGSYRLLLRYSDSLGRSSLLIDHVSGMAIESLIRFQRKRSWDCWVGTLNELFRRIGIATASVVPFN